MNTREFKGEWLEHRKVLQKLLEEIGDEHIDYKPWDKAMPLGKLVLHVTGWNKAFLEMVKTEKLERPEFPEINSMEDIRTFVRNITGETLDLFASISDEELREKNQSTHPRLSGTKRNYVRAMYDHEIHHKGQLFVYARCIGVRDIPFFR